MPLLQSETSGLVQHRRQEPKPHKYSQAAGTKVEPSGFPSPIPFRQVSGKLSHSVLLLGHRATLQDQRLLHMDELSVSSFCYAYDLNEGAAQSRLD